MIPFFIFYSMFGFQRIGDLIWAAADMRGRGLPARRHRRPHDADRRGAAAPGRPQPPPRLDRVPNLERLRSGLRLRARGHRARRHPPHVRAERGHLLLPHARQRELRDAGDAGGRRARASCAASTAAARPTSRSTATRVAAPRLAARSSTRRCARRRCWPSATASPPTSGASPPTRSCGARRSRSSAGTACTRAEAPRVSYVTRASGRARAGRRGLGLHEARCRTRSRAGCRALTPLGTDGFGRSAPRGAARLLRGRRPAHRPRRPGQLARQGEIAPASSPRPCASSASTPGPRQPARTVIQAGQEEQRCRRVHFPEPRRGHRQRHGRRGARQTR